MNNENCRRADRNPNTVDTRRVLANEYAQDSKNKTTEERSNEWTQRTEGTE